MLPVERAGDFKEEEEENCTIHVVLSEKRNTIISRLCLRLRVTFSFPGMYALNSEYQDSTAPHEVAVIKKSSLTGDLLQ